MDSEMLMDSHQDEVHALVYDLEQARLEVSSLRKSLSSVERHHENVLKELQVEEHARAEAEDHVENLNASLGEMKQLIKDLQQQVYELTSLVDEAKMDANRHYTTTLVLETDLNAMRMRLIESQERCELLDHTHLQLQETLETERWEHQLHLQTCELKASRKETIAQAKEIVPVVLMECFGVQVHTFEPVCQVAREWLFLFVPIALIRFITFIWPILVHEHGTLDSSRWKHVLLNAIYKLESVPESPF